MLPQAEPWPFEYGAEALSRVRDLSARFEVDSAGHLRRFANDSPLDDVTSSFVSALMRIVLPLPKEPVGVGATWIVNQTMANRLSHYEYTLVSMGPDKLETLVTGWAADAHPMDRKLLIPRLKTYFDYGVDGVPSEYLVRGHRDVYLRRPMAVGTDVMFESRAVSGGEVHAVWWEDLYPGWSDKNGD